MAGEDQLTVYQDSVYARPGMTHQIRRFGGNPGRG